MQELTSFIRQMQKNPKYQQAYNETTEKILRHPEVQSFIQAHQENLSQEMIWQSMSKLNEFVQEKEKAQAGQPGINPGFTPELFINLNHIDVTYVPTADFLHQQSQKHRQALIDNRMMSRDVRNARLDQYDQDSPQRIQLVKEVISFIEQYRQDPHQAKALYISGPFGVGKTYLMGALANYLVEEDVRVTMLHYPTFASDLKDSFRDNTTGQMIDEVKSVDVLIVDDIGAESNTAWLRDEVLSVILEYRMKEALPTFFTSNFSMAELQQHLAQTSRDGYSEAKARRLMERFYFLAKEVQLDGPNRRLNP